MPSISTYLWWIFTLVRVNTLFLNKHWQTICADRHWQTVCADNNFWTIWKLFMKIDKGAYLIVIMLQSRKTTLPIYWIIHHWRKFVSRPRQYGIFPLCRRMYLGKPMCGKQETHLSHILVICPWQIFLTSR